MCEATVCCFSRSAVAEPSAMAHDVQDVHGLRLPVDRPPVLHEHRVRRVR